MSLRKEAKDKLAEKINKNPVDTKAEELIAAIDKKIKELISKESVFIDVNTYLEGGKNYNSAQVIEVYSMDKSSEARRSETIKALEDLKAKLLEQ